MTYVEYLNHRTKKDRQLKKANSDNTITTPPILYEEQAQAHKEQQD